VRRRLRRLPRDLPPSGKSRPTLGLYADSGLPGSTIGSEAEWNIWIHAQDTDVRSRIDRGAEDSISNFILYGTSYTELPRLKASDDATDSAGKISTAAVARSHALGTALQSSLPGERLEFIRSFLRKRGLAPSEWENFLIKNLQRFAREQQAYQQKLAEAAKSRDINEIMSVRGTLYQSRGLSADTSLLPNFAIEETLRAMLNMGALHPGSMRRIAIVGPGLDFTDKRDGYDFYPPQTIQPFAILDTVRRLGLASPQPAQVFALDLNPAVNAHVRDLAARGRAGQSYALQLPRDVEARWSEAAVAYWKEFGSAIGTSVKPLPVPGVLSGIESRAVSVRPALAASIVPLDLNVVAQTLDLEGGEGFDLVVATNILVYYDVFQQSLAMNNIAHMMNRGGIFVANNALPARHDPRLKYLGRKSVFFAEDGSYGDDMVVYQRQ